MKNKDTPLSKITLDIGSQPLKNVDSRMRKRRHKLSEYRKGYSRFRQQCEELSLNIKTEPSLEQTLNYKINTSHVQILKAEQNRFATCQRNKKNNQIYFKKRSSASIYYSPKKASRSSSNLKQGKRICENNSLNTLQLKKQGQSKSLLPFMLQKRRKKLEKSIQIIDHHSRQSINELDVRQKTIFDRYYTEQRKLIDKMKGTKIYYQFVKEWRHPVSRGYF